MAGISEIRASAVEDVSANLLGKFYLIAGFTFLVLTATYTVIAVLTIQSIKTNPETQHQYNVRGFSLIIATCVVTVPLFARSIFDLCIGSDESVRDSVGVTDQAAGEHITLFLTCGIFLDFVPFMAQLASLYIMNRIEHVVS